MATGEKRSIDEVDDELAFAQSVIEKLRLTGTLTRKERMFILDVIKDSDQIEERDNDDPSVTLVDKGVQANVKVGKEKRIQTVDVRPSEEGEASTSRKKSLTSRKKSPTKSLMDKTYIKRRSYILTEKPMISDVKKKYPDLFTVSEMKRELDRIFYEGKCEEFLKRISDHAQIMLDDSDCHLLINGVRDIMAKAPSEMERKYAMEVAAVLIIPPTCGEEKQFFLKFEVPEEDENYPYICTNTKNYMEFFTKGLWKFKVIVEHIQVAETYDFLEATLVYFASFYVFDIHYPPTYRNMHYFMEKLYLNATDTDESELNETCRRALKSISEKKKPPEVEVVKMILKPIPAETMSDTSEIEVVEVVINSNSSDMKNLLMVKNDESVSSEINNSSGAEVGESISSERNSASGAEVSKSISSEMNSSGAEVGESISSEINNASGAEVSKSISLEINSASGTEVSKSISSEMNHSSEVEILESISSEINNASGAEVSKSISLEINSASGAEVSKSISSEMNHSSEVEILESISSKKNSSEVELIQID